MNEIPRLSASIGHKLTTECPLSAWSAHRLLGNHKQKTTDSQLAGRLWHAGILEGNHGVEVLDFDAFRSADAKKARDKALHDGKIPITRGKWDAMQVGVARIREQLAEHGILFDGKIEERIEWDQQATTGETVACSGYIDHRQGLCIDDLKTGSACTSIHMAKSLIQKSHSLLQDAAYRSAIATIHGEDRERCEMRFIFVQTEEPYTDTPVKLSGEFRELSYLRWQRAIDTWAKCLGKGVERKHWPGPVAPGCTDTIHPDGWMLARELEMEELRS